MPRTILGDNPDESDFIIPDIQSPRAAITHRAPRLVRTTDFSGTTAVRAVDEESILDIWVVPDGTAGEILEHFRITGRGEYRHDENVVLGHLNRQSR